MMAEKSGFFNSIDGDRTYTADDFAGYFSPLIGNGIFPLPIDGLKVQSENGLNIAVRAGKAWINGYMYENTEAKVIQLAAAETRLKRIDRIVLRLDFQTRDMHIAVKSSAPSIHPLAPALQRDAAAYELCLADVTINAGNTTINNTQIVDRRADIALCGTVTGLVKPVDGENFINETVIKRIDTNEHNIDEIKSEVSAATSDCEAIKGYIGYPIAGDVVGIDVAFTETGEYIKRLGCLQGYPTPSTEHEFLTGGVGDRTRLDGLKRVVKNTFNTLKPWAGRRRCNITDAGTLVAYAGTKYYTESGVLLDNVVKTDEGGNELQVASKGDAVHTMVEQPPFYVRMIPLETGIDESGTPYMTHFQLYVSSTYHEGFKLQEDFTNNILPNYYAAFESSIRKSQLVEIGDSDDGIADEMTPRKSLVQSRISYIFDTEDTPLVADIEHDKLCSIAGANIVTTENDGIVEYDFSAFESMLPLNILSGRDGKWELQNLASLSASQILFLVEYATFDVFSAIGSGNNGLPQKTGLTSSIGNASGVISNNEFDNIAVSYRGEENLWGNVIKYISGVMEEPYGGENGINSTLGNPEFSIRLWKPTEGGYASSLLLTQYFLPATFTNNAEESYSGTSYNYPVDCEITECTKCIAYGGKPHPVGLNPDAGLFSYCVIPTPFLMLGTETTGIFPTVRIKYRPAANASNQIPSNRVNVTHFDRIGNTEVILLSDYVDEINGAISNITDRLNNMNPANVYMINSWSDVQQIVRSGKAYTAFKLGDILVCNHSEFGLVDFEIVGRDEDCDADGVRHPSITLMTKHALNVNAWLKYNAEGINRWSTSDLRKWANSDAENGEWYLDETHTDADAIPEEYRTHNGFLHGFDPEMLAVITPVKKTTAVHTYPGGEVTSDIEETTDLFFAPSLTEVNGGENNGIWENDPYYYFYDDTEESGGFGTGYNATRSRFNDYWLRSPSPDDGESVYFSSELIGRIFERKTTERMSVVIACVVM